MTIPCPLCGYDAPQEPCPHCAGTSTLPSLAERPKRALGLWTGLVAVPQGMRLLLTTRGVKRWLLPPLILTVLVLFGSLAWGWSILGELTGEALPESFEIGAPEWTWLTDLTERWEWLGAALGWLSGAFEWIVNHFYGLLANRFTGFLLYAMFGVAASWYLFSIAYEAFAGPFLDEVHSRFESKWFGRDPRSTLERPTDIPASRCVQLSALAFGPPTVVLVAALLTPLALGLVPLVLLVTVGAAALVDRRYGTWLAWIGRIEGRALWVGIKASTLAGVIVVLALPLYLVPFGVGYVLFATICGFATAISLLDIPAERRGWSVRQRLGLLRRHLLPFTVFGVVSGFLLAIPVFGALLMVPSASVGGLWMLCRLDKQSMREGRRGPATAA